MAKSSGGKGGGGRPGGGGGQGGKGGKGGGSGQGAGWPSKTCDRSGLGRDNNPPGGAPKR